MSEYSYATERKIRVIKEQLGPNWANSLAGRSIDAVYNDIMGDDRKNLFCKINARSKARLDEMVTDHRASMAEFVEQLIEAEWSRYQARNEEAEKRLLAEYSGS